MEKFDKIQERLPCRAAIVEKSKIKDFIQEFGNSLLNKPRIPNIIHLSKTYESFSWNISEEILKSINLNDTAIILLSQELNITKYLICDVELALNLNFYSHSELIKMLTPINLEFSAYEIIGDIIHLNLSDQQLEHKQLIADIIHFKTGKTVINKTGKIEDTYRFYQSEILAGPSKLTTVHKENDVKIYLDLGKVYWCSRLQSERIRILKMIKAGQVVCDPFCGVGPHIIPAIKKGVKALCNDLNPAAIDCLKISLELNDIECDCVENMDAGAFLEKYKSMKVDHFIFNLPEHSLEYVKYTEQYEGNFYLHVFFFCRSSVEVTEYIKSITGYKVKPEWLREVRKVSPSKSVYKLEVKSLEFFEYQKL